ncbi:MAG: M28 family peptidase [Acidobacteria bacterium]|nr:M28 family peptidase [Acidobacteriota bacterium]
MVRTAVGATALACLLLACSGSGNNQMAAAAPAVPAADQQPSPLPVPVIEGRAGSSPLAQASAQGAAPLTFDSSRAYEHLRRQVGFGPRPAGSAALARCREYILTELAAVGIETREDAFEATTPLGAVQMVNVIATIPGRRAERIALATHYDTKLFREFRFVGASDGASSTAAVLELARVLASRQNEFTIELLFFDGEEAAVDWFRNNDNTYGSRRYVQEAQDTGSLGGLEALVLLDMIGDRELTIRRDTNSTPWLTDIIWASAATLGHQAYFLDQRVTIEDDHVPFLRAGIPSVDIIDLDYPAWHTAQDDLAHVSARSLQVVGDVVLDAWPRIEQHLSAAQ